MSIDPNNFMDCPECHSEYGVLCMECGSSVRDCICNEDSLLLDAVCVGCGTEFSVCPPEIEEEPDEEDDFMYGCTCDPPKKYYCGVCNLQRDTALGEWYPIPTTTKKSFAPTYYTPKCRHYHQAVELPNGVTVHCSSLHDSRESEPDFGLYADYSWHPQWRNEFIDWPDFKDPSNPNLAFDQIFDLYDKACDGLDVEFGCIGGHGRTGTILACLVVLVSGPQMTTAEAVTWVRKHYCPNAVESKSQIWFIDYFRHLSYPYDVPVPEKPVDPISPSSSCSVESHVAMWMRGYRECANKPECKLWVIDVANIKNGAITDVVMENAKGLLPKFAPKVGGVILPEDVKNHVHSWEEHLAMLHAGWNKCAIYGSDCPEWTEDKIQFEASADPVKAFGMKWKAYAISAPQKGDN